MPDSSLNLQKFPPIYVFESHLTDSKRREAEQKVLAAKGPLTHDASTARLFLCNILQKKRAALDLRSHNIWAEEVLNTPTVAGMSAEEGEPPFKIRKIDLRDQNLSSQVESLKRMESSHRTGSVELNEMSREESVWLKEGVSIKVVNYAWLDESEKKGRALSLMEYLIYEGVKTEWSTGRLSPAGKKTVSSLHTGRDILIRAEAEPNSSPSADSATRSSKNWISTSQISKSKENKTSNLLRQTTSEGDVFEELPEMPSWVKNGSTYSCDRATPMEGPNNAFVRELKKIRLARILTSDEIGIRAYSTSIAAVAAYPHKIVSWREILALPGCESKIATLWVEFNNSNGTIQAVRDAENDQKLKILHLFYDIWGVGAHTARAFYDRGWRDVDDIVEFGWSELTRVQQIGVKYYDDFQVKIPRKEVEFIAKKVKEYAQRVREPMGVRICIVGGYRRGKLESGDADIILTHLDEAQTLNIVKDVVHSLMDDGWITHELKISAAGTCRDQATLPHRQIGGGHGFDSLDKALVVWQNPYSPTEVSGGLSGAASSAATETDAAVLPRAWVEIDRRLQKDLPTPHRRVDIIAAPWSKIGCAVLGWTAETTFERDLRRYARKMKGWKFDSSGVRDRMSGDEVDLEGVGGKCTTIEEAERKVFSGLGLEYREPWERCTG